MVDFIRYSTHENYDFYCKLRKEEHFIILNLHLLCKVDVIKYRASANEVINQAGDLCGTRQ